MFAGRIQNFVGYHVVNRLEPGRRHVADAAHLNRRGTIRQRGQAVVARVPRKVDGDVNFVVVNFRGKLLGTQVLHVNEMLHAAPIKLREIVVLLVAAVAGNLEF